MDEIATFRTTCETLMGETPSAERRLGLAVSGGPDSLAMLLLGKDAFPGAIAAATVDHGLRPEAADEARHAAQICLELDVPHEILTPDAPITGNLQSEARAARYALLERWRQANGLGWIATAHHADDQLETVLMRLMRGSGVGGLAAIRPVNGHVIRPLLHFRKATLEVTVAQSPFEATQDPTNEDDRYDRARMRKLLSDWPGFSADRLNRSVAALRDADDALEWVVRRIAGKKISSDGEAVILRLSDETAEIRRRMVLHCLRRLEPGLDPRADALAGFISALETGEKARIGGLIGEIGGTKTAVKWRFSPAPQRKTG